MEQLKEWLPHVKGETPAVSSFVREDREETYTHTPPVKKNNAPLTGQQSHHEAPTPEVSVLAQATDAVASLEKQIQALSERVSGQMRKVTNMELAGLAHFSPDIRSATIPVGMKLPSFTKFTGKIDPEEHSP
ncbi:hypothetical protein LIER_29015 [Lithospermum erythrorhizon]|uniref:Uncharacterized protein n=1 Tax=Lithospermum erythrorhizon TaxID=34254 RepID=A0AAV3RL90_LITER